MKFLRFKSWKKLTYNYKVIVKINYIKYVINYNYNYIFCINYKLQLPQPW